MRCSSGSRSPSRKRQPAYPSADCPEAARTDSRALSLGCDFHRAVVTEYAWQTTSCDPCPTPPLEAADLYTLGDEDFAGAAKPEGPAGKRGVEYYGSPPSYVLTRLHTRYDRKSLDADLIFRAAPPAVGGRANGDGGLGDLAAQILGSGENNFQARYIIRHNWRAARRRRALA